MGKRRHHDNNTGITTVPGADTPQFASEEERFSSHPERTRSPSPVKDITTVERERSKAYSEVRWAKMNRDKDRIAEYANSLDAKIEANDKARINGKTHQKFKYFKAIARMERISDRMAAKNLGFLTNA